MKKLFCLLMAALLVFALAGCKKAVKSDGGVQSDKIGIITGCGTEDQEELCAAKSINEKYAGETALATYTDATSLLLAAQTFAGDPSIKALIIVKAGDGTLMAIDKAKQLNPELLIICGAPSEDVAAIAGKADIVMLFDKLKMGAAIPEKAAGMGAATLIHYSCASLLADKTVAAYRELMIAACEQCGVTYLDVTAPDPTGGTGIDGAKQFIMDDVARQVAQYGKDTAFFSSDDALQEPLISAVLEQGAIFPQQSNPSPFCGYPAALDIDVSSHEGDVSYMLDNIKAKLTERAQQGRMSTWGASVNKLMLQSGVEYALRYIQGVTGDASDGGEVDESALLSLIHKFAGGEDKCAVSKYTLGDMTLPNCYAVLLEYYDFQ